MSNITSIQWADTTVNPVMGCGGCELFPTPEKVLQAIDKAMSEVGSKISSRTIFKDLVQNAFQRIDKPLEGHKNVVNTTNIWHLRKQFLDHVVKEEGKVVAAAAEKAIKQSITCYAATLHFNKGQKITKPEYLGHKGHAPIFESIRRYEGKCAAVARLQDLLGRSNPKTPWKDRLPRLIFVSDMGDALSSKSDFEFLERDLIPAVTSKKGKRHLWLWLSKRPERMAQFAEEIGGLPENMCAMSTLTGPDEENLNRLKALKSVRATSRGLSIEPLWGRIPVSKLDLTGIDWVIVGGESGAGLAHTRPFALEWAEEIRDHCKKHGVAFFLKQFGRNPSRDGKVFKLRHTHGGNWDEWPDEDLKVREFPAIFHAYRSEEMKISDKLRPVKKNKKGDDQSDESGEKIDENARKSELATSENLQAAIIAPEKAEFERLNEIVRNGVEAFVEAGVALQKIHNGKLWKAGGFSTWEDYCRSVAGMSRAHAHRLMQASECVYHLKQNPYIPVLPIAESQVRPLLRLDDGQMRYAAWIHALDVMGEDRKQPTANEVRQAVEYVIHTDDEGDPVEKAPTRAKQRTELVSQIRAAVAERRSWEDVEKLLQDLEKLI